MATKFRIKVPRIKFVNRCILCGKVISSGAIICSDCSKKIRKKLR